ncbi:hypothetical protein [Crocosphaera sp.]|uniref:hypothetical protein n=1 Tax=Crocosphaera sp. TaxID=2729996 RepID=UPI003F263543
MKSISNVINSFNQEGSGEEENNQFTLYQQSRDASFYLWGENGVFNSTQSVYVITHGWQNAGFTDNDFATLAQSIIQYDPNANIFFTDWTDLSSNYNYLESARDTAIVGQQLGEFLLGLDIDTDKTTLIGHSLGAHISGIAADTYDRLTGEVLNTVIGLDSAGLSFEDGLTDESGRLDATDANRVVELHSTSIFGYDDSMGDLDVYLNWNDTFQPGESSLMGNHYYPVDLLANLYQGASYTQEDGSVFELDDLFTLEGVYDINTTV